MLRNVLQLLIWACRDGEGQDVAEYAIVLATCIPMAPALPTTWSTSRESFDRQVPAAPRLRDIRLRSRRNVCFHHIPIRVILSRPSRPLDAARIEAIVLAFEHEQRIRALIKTFADEKDPQRLKVLAAELEQLLTLESKPWSLRDDKAE
jgi:hypothetical protein